MNSSDEQAIRDMHEHIISAFNQYDLDKLLTWHTNDVVVMEANRPIISGINEVREVFTKAFEHIKQQGLLFNLSFKIHELEVWGERAFARGQVNKITKNDDGSIKEESGKYLCLFKKQADGTWLRSHVIANDDGPVKSTDHSLWKE